VEGLLIHRPDDEDILGYRTIFGKVAIDRDAMDSQSHAFQVTYHELLEDISARTGDTLRSYHKLHDGIVQYFVRKTTRNQKMKYYLSAYEDRADIVARLIQKGVPEELWKSALVDNNSFRELMQRTNTVLECKQGFREIEWALENNDWRTIKQLLSGSAPDIK